MRPMLVTLAVLFAGCGPQAAEPDDPPRGELVIDGWLWQVYRDEDRLEQVPNLETLPDDLDPEEFHRCGHLTERAMEDIQTWTAGLDPTHDYNEDAADCIASHNPRFFHLSGFEHSPFACGIICCRCCAPVLSRLVYVYRCALQNLDGGSLPDENGQPYIAIDPERPCDD